MAETEQVISYAISRAQFESREGMQTGQILSEVAHDPEFGEEYTQDVIDLYNQLLGEVEDVTSEDSYAALVRLRNKARKEGDRNWKEIPLTLATPKRKLFAAALKGLDLLAQGVIGEDDLRGMTPDQMGPRQRELYYRRMMFEIREKFGLAEDFDSDQLLALLGDVATIAPEEFGNIRALMERNGAEVFPPGKITDEQHIFIAAMGDQREGGTYQSVMALSNIDHLSVEQYRAVLSKLHPNEMFFLAHMPFKIKDANGNEISIRAADVVDFLLTPEGKKVFRMSPNIKAKKSLSAYINWLRDKYPDAQNGLSITSGFSVATAEGSDRWKTAEVLDKGLTPVAGINEPHVAMAENTWNNLLRMSMGMANLLVSRGELYRGSSIGLIGTEIQKTANAWTHYLDMYTMLDGVERQKLPRFGGLEERMTPDPLKWLFPQGGTNEAPLQPDLKDPYHPRDWEDRNGGVEIVRPFANEQERFSDLLFLTHLFFTVEEDPASFLLDTAVAELVAGANDHYVDYTDTSHMKAPMSRDELIKLAWEYEEKMRESVLGQARLSDEKLETLMKYRTYYAAPPETVRRRLLLMPPEYKAKLDRFDFKGLVVRLGGVVDPAKSYQGVDGASEVIEQMGSGVWARASWGTQPNNAPEKHGGYEEQMVEVYKAIAAESVASVQARTGELEKAAGTHLVGKQQDLSERATALLDEIVQGIKGVQAEPKFRLDSLHEVHEKYTAAVDRVGFMGKMRGYWWLYRYSTMKALAMIGREQTPMYLSADKQSSVKREGKPYYVPVLPGKALASYDKLYDLEAPNLVDALAIIGAKIDDGVIVYPAKASGLHPIAMEKQDGKVRINKHRVGFSEYFEHERQVPENARRALHKYLDAFWEVLVDKKVASSNDKAHFVYKH